MIYVKILLKSLSVLDLQAKVERATIGMIRLWLNIIYWAQITLPIAEHYISYRL